MDWNQLVQNGVSPLVALFGLAWLVHRKYLTLGRETERENERANKAETRVALLESKLDRYEDLILKGRSIVADAASSHEEIVDELVELTRRHGGMG